MKHKQFAAVVIAAMVSAQMPLTAFAGNWYLEDGDIYVNATEEKQTVSQGGGSADDDAPVITQRDSSTATDNTVTINAAAGATAEVTLDGVNIDVSGTGDPRQDIDGEAAISTTGNGNVTIELDHTNTIKSGNNRAGLEKNNDGELCITAEDTSDCLNASGGEGGAGIGGGQDGNGSSITITGGNVTATGGFFGAGIGGGQDGNGSSITITGGSVKASGGGFGAGIGGGNHGSGSDITITSGSATVSGGRSGAGIGGGQEGNGSSITISGGSVTVLGGDYGAGIGGGLYGNGSSITISGGSATVSGGRSGAGIGGGNGDFGVGGNGSDIVISGDAQLKVQGGEKKDHGTGAAIGNGDDMREGGGGREVEPDTSNLSENGYVLYYDPDGNMGADQPTAVIHYGNTERHEGTLTVTPAVDATCAIDGSTMGLKCTCGKIDIEPQTIEATGQHNIVIDAEAVEPTYTSTGLTEAHHCTTCDTQTVEQEVIPMLQHKTTPSAAANTTGEAAENSAYAASAETTLYRVINAEGTELAYAASQENGVLTITVNQKTAVLTGYLSGISQLKAQGIETIVFGTTGRASAFRLEDLLANGNGGDSYRLTHIGAAAAFTIGAANTDISAILF